MSRNPQCPRCGQSKFDVVDGARCIICDNIVRLETYDYGPSSAKGKITECRHREDGQVKCTSCDGERTFDDVSSDNASYEEFTGIDLKPKRKWWEFWK